MFQSQKSSDGIPSILESKESTAQVEQYTTSSRALLSTALDSARLDESAGQARARRIVQVRTYAVR